MLFISPTPVLSVVPFPYHSFKCHSFPLPQFIRCADFPLKLSLGPNGFFNDFIPPPYSSRSFCLINHYPFCLTKETPPPHRTCHHPSATLSSDQSCIISSLRVTTPRKLHPVTVSTSLYCLLTFAVLPSLKGNFKAELMAVSHDNDF